MSNRGLEIEINSLASVPLTFKNANLYFNIDAENDFKLVNTQSLSSFDKTIIKIQNLNDNKEFYVFLTNTNIVIKDNKATINTFSRVVLYEQNKEFFAKQSSKDILKDINAEISFLTASQSIGLRIDEATRLNVLKRQQFELKMKQKLFLVEYEGDFDE
ncbi:MSC_0621 family F1-like ATPase epsilon subunit [Mycoplasma simbae]|uniref:MSC_0621 family F1-like ATPase epsilon subunit n=1 Tax=Mycoplasma simbae TaxID=36744 RepID=UPI0004952647|nr:hypothetical protein [Mycoplasma simbae]